jgi:hypothetical protein
MAHGWPTDSESPTRVRADGNTGLPTAGLPNCVLAATGSRPVFRLRDENALNREQRVAGGRLRVLVGASIVDPDLIESVDGTGAASC